MLASSNGPRPPRGLALLTGSHPNKSCDSQDRDGCSDTANQLGLPISFAGLEQYSPPVLLLWWQSGSTRGSSLLTKLKPSQGRFPGSTPEEELPGRFDSSGQIQAVLCLTTPLANPSTPNLD